MPPSPSTVSYMRAQTRVPLNNLEGSELVSTEWHAVVPGYGGEAPWPGLACGTPLDGVLQREGSILPAGAQLHEQCRRIVARYLAGKPAPKKK